MLSSVSGGSKLFLTVLSLSARAVFELLLEAEERLQHHIIWQLDQSDLKGPLKALKEQKFMNLDSLL